MLAGLVQRICGVASKKSRLSCLALVDHRIVVAKKPKPELNHPKDWLPSDSKATGIPLVNRWTSLEQFWRTTQPVCGELLILAECLAVAQTCASVGER